MADVNKDRETVVPAWPERLRAQSTFKADAEASKHSPPIRDEKAQIATLRSLQAQAVARLGRKDK